MLPWFYVTVASLVINLGTRVHSAVDYASPLVFDARFYINTNADLHSSHTLTESAAKNHWLNTGMLQGRQGCGSFNAKQYLQKYPDLTNVFQNHYKRGVEHFLEFGHKEHRMPFLEGEQDGRWTISNEKDLFVSASRRMGGAIDSVVWNNREFINAWDHGRELQMAVNTVPFGECFNPTEAGGATDASGPGTTTKIISASSTWDTLTTTIHPSFWIRADSHEHGSGTSQCGKGAHAINKVDTYEQPMSKTVHIGCGVITHCIEYFSDITISSDWPSGYHFMQFEAPTGYMSPDFTSEYRFDPHTSQLTKNLAAEHMPLVFATPDGQYAMGAYAPTGQDASRGVGYDRFQFLNVPYADATVKWNVVFRNQPLAVGQSHVFHFKSYICIGNLDMVTRCMHDIHAQHSHA